MTPELEQLSAQLVAAAERFAAQQRPGVPIDLAAPEAQQIRAMLEEIQRKAQQFQDEETAKFQAAVKASQPPPPPPPAENLADLLKEPAAITFRFQERHAPSAETMARVVQTLLKLGAE